MKTYKFYLISKLCHIFLEDNKYVKHNSTILRQSHRFLLNFRTDITHLTSLNIRFRCEGKLVGFSPENILAKIAAVQVVTQAKYRSNISSPPSLSNSRSSQYQISNAVLL